MIQPGNTWTTGPDLPGGEEDSFAPAAFVHGGNLYVSLADGNPYRLSASKQEWEKSGKTTPRIAHRLASGAEGILVIGGAANGRNSDLIESIAEVTPGILKQ